MIQRFRVPTLLALAAALIALGIVSSGGAADAASSRTDVIIGFKGQPGPAEQALVQQAGGTIKYTYHLVPAIAAAVPEAAIAGLQANPNVTSVDLDGEVHVIDHPTGDPELDSGWGVAHIGSGAVHASNKGTGVKVAVIDTGIDHTHPDLNANFAGGHDFVNNDTDPMDDYGHGTHVGGTIAAEDDGAGVVGVAPAASLYGLKVLNANGSGKWSDIIAAVQWAVDNGIQVTNNSYGSSINPGGIVQAAFDNSAAAGILHVASAGNSGNCGGKGNNVGYPARFASVIAVAATDQNDQRPCFSSTGSDVELAGPGVRVNSTVPTGGEDGDGCALCDDSGYKLLSGTSMASPHAAGTAALVIAANPGWSNDQVRTQLQTTADDLGDPGRDKQYGYGLVDADEAAAPSGPPAPAVNVALSTDKTDYVSGTDTTAVLTAVVTDETGVAISGLADTAVATTVDGVAAAVTFTETATAGTYTGNLDVSGLPDGTHTVEVTVTDSRPVSGSGSATFTIGPAPPAEPTVSVSSITYTTEGGKNKDKHLLINVALLDDLNPVSGASVSIKLENDTSGGPWFGTGTTGADGTVTFSLKNAPSGCYTTTVTDVTAEGLTWDSATPGNEFGKGATCP